MNTCLKCSEYLFLSLLGQISVFTKRNPVILWVSAVIFSVIVSIHRSCLVCLLVSYIYSRYEEKLAHKICISNTNTKSVLLVLRDAHVLIFVILHHCVALWMAK